MAEKTYKNIGGAPVLGKAPGRVFKADLSEDQRKRMIARGSIEEVDPKVLAEQEAPEETEDSEETAENAVADEVKPEVKDGDAKAGTTPPLPPVPPGGKTVVPPAQEKKG